MSDQEINEIAAFITDENKVEFILDAIMYLSGIDQTFIRTTAFSTLSSLSKYSS